MTDDLQTRAINTIRFLSAYAMPAIVMLVIIHAHSAAKSPSLSRFDLATSLLISNGLYLRCYDV